MVIRNFKKYIVFSISLSLLLTQCNFIVDSYPVPEVELPKIQISIDSESHTTLINNTYADFYVPVIVEIDDRIYNADIQYQGHCSRADVRKSYKLEFPDKSLFHNNQKKLILSAQLRDPSFMRYQLSLLLFKAAGLLTLQTDLAALFINDEFQGIYLTIEPIDEYFLAKRGIPPGNLYKAVDGKARFSFKDGYRVRSGFEKKINEDDNYSDLEQLILLLDITPDSLLDSVIGSVVDVENVLNYLAVSVLINNWDGFCHNFYFFHNPATDRFYFIPYDLDMTLGVGDAHESLHVNGHGSKGVNALFERLLSHPPWRAYYKEKILRMLDSVFTTDFLSQEMESIYECLANDYKKDPLIQRLGYNLEDEMNVIKQYIDERSEFIRMELETF